MNTSKSKQTTKKRRAIGVFQGLPNGSSVDCCFPCAKKIGLMLCGTPEANAGCEYCKAENIYYIQ